MESRLFHLQNLTALHVGTGQGVGVVDLPIARAKATNLPLVPGSAIKGVLRDELPIEEHDKKTLFGPYSEEENNAHAGAIAFGDAHLLLLPIRSFAGTLAYATCPYILQQYKRDTGTQLKVPNFADIAGIVEDSALMVGNSYKIALEDLDIEANHNATINDWAEFITSNLYPDTVKDADAWREQVKKRFVILPDNMFSFLADTATEVRTRIRIERETRVVKQGALWTEENLPAEAVLWGMLGVSMSRNKKDERSAKDLAALLPEAETRIQIGGKHTVGRGLCRLLITNIQA